MSRGPTPGSISGYFNCSSCKKRPRVVPNRLIFSSIAPSRKFLHCASHKKVSGPPRCRWPATFSYMLNRPASRLLLLDDIALHWCEYAKQRGLVGFLDLELIESLYQIAN